MAETLAIHCRGLSLTYPGNPPVEAVRGLDLDVPQGQCFGLLGPNGAGKTTTVEIFEGLLTADAGEVSILGMSWSRQARALRQRIGVSLQETQLAEKLTIAETIGLFASFYDKPRSIDDLIAAVSLQEKRSAFVGKLSGGQKQRLAVAIALAGDPELLFLDEPTTGLDPQSRRQLWDVIRELRGRGRTIVLTTHYMDEAERLCDRIAVIDHGRVIALGTPRELIASLGGDHVVELSLADDPLAAPLETMSGTAGEAPHDPLLEGLRSLPGVTASRREAGIIQLTVRELHVSIPALLDRMTNEGRHLTHLSTRQASLEDVFVNLTGRHLRDA